MKKFFEVVEKVFVLLLNVLIMGCPFAAYPHIWNSLQVDDIPFWGEILLIFFMGALVFNAIFSMKRLIDMCNDKPKADVIDIDVFLKDNDVFEYVAVKRNGKVIKTKSRTEVKEQSYGKKN